MAHGKLPAKQRGVVLLITLIVLVVLTLGAISLIRSVDTTNLISGNLAFRQSAVYAGDAGTEAAVDWLQSQSQNTLNGKDALDGYSPSFDPLHDGTPTWDGWWQAQVVGNGLGYKTLAADAAGNVVSYHIDRMCKGLGAPSTAGCAQSITSGTNPNNSSSGAGSQNLNSTTQYYYRITSRIEGPRNTVSYIQTMVAL